MINQDFHFEISELIGSKHIDHLMRTVETSEAAARMQSVALPVFFALNGLSCVASRIIHPIYDLMFLPVQPY